MLHMNLLDFILHSTCLHYTDVNEINYYLGWTITRQLFPRWFMPITYPNADQKFDKKCTPFIGFERGKHRCVIPDVDEAHYNVIDVIIDNNSKNFIAKVCFYDSMTSPTASGKKNRIIPACTKEFIANLVGVFNKSCFKPKKKCSCQLKIVLQHIVQIGCPTQMNGIDCGLFAVMNCLHIFDDVAINPSIFAQEHTTKLCKILPHMLGYEKNATRFYIHSIFPCLQAVISQHLSSDVILKYSKCFPLGVPEIMKHIKINVNGSELGTTTTNDGPGFIVCDLNQASPNPLPSRGKQLHLPVWDETSSSSLTSSNLFDKKQPAKDNLSMAQEQTVLSLTKHTSSSSSLSVPTCCGKLIKLKPPPDAQAEALVRKKHDDDLSTTTSSSVHSGMQAFELLIEDDDLYFNMKQPANTNFPENNKTQSIAQHIFNCNIGGTTDEDVTMEVHQPIEYHPIEQLELTVSPPTPENIESVTMKKKEVNVENTNHKDEFKECMESDNIQNGADSFDIIVNAIAFYEGRHNIQLVIQKSTPDSYSQYRCKQHEGCPFQISFRRQ